MELVLGPQVDLLLVSPPLHRWLLYLRFVKPRLSAPVDRRLLASLRVVMGSQVAGMLGGTINNHTTRRL
jgi:hypothetical protein